MENLIGLDFNSAQQKELKGKDYRIVRVDNTPMMITCDFKIERLNLEIEDGVIVNVYEG